MCEWMVTLMAEAQLVLTGQIADNKRATGLSVLLGAESSVPAQMNNSQQV